MATLFLLSSYAALASVAVVVRARFSSRVEALLATFMVWNFVVLVPIHLLGVTGHLTAANLAGASFVTSSAAFAGSFWRAGAASGHARNVALSMAGMARLPWDAVSACVRARSLVLVGVVASIAVIAWTAWLSYLLPSDSWDGLWYHETMVGYAIQSHGYTPANLPQGLGFPADMIQQTNGFPRNCEMTALWFVIFWDHRLIEVVNSVMVIPLALATYVLAMRYSKDRVVALGWCSALVLTPAVALQLRSTYMDVHVAAFFLAALHFCTRTETRIRDGWMATLCLSLLIGSKSQALVWVPSMGAVGLLRLAWAHGRARPTAVALTSAGGAALIGAFASLTYLRNWLNFKNPLWPLSYDRVWPKIHWKGLATVSQFGENWSMEKTFHSVTSARPFGAEFPDTGPWAWGWGLVFLLVPLASIAFPLLCVWVIRALIDAAVLKKALGDESRAALNLLLVLALLVVAAYASHVLWHPRYNIHVAAGIMLLVHWFSARARRLGEGAVVFSIMGNLLYLFWAKPAWGADFEEARHYARMPALERATLATSAWSITKEAAAARERELGPGSVVVFTDDFMFPPLLWNERYEDRVVYFPHVAPAVSADAFIARAQLERAQWIVVSSQGDLDTLLGAQPSAWVLVGFLTRGHTHRVYRSTFATPVRTP